MKSGRHEFDLSVEIGGIAVDGADEGVLAPSDHSVTKFARLELSGHDYLEAHLGKTPPQRQASIFKFANGFNAHGWPSFSSMNRNL